MSVYKLSVKLTNLNKEGGALQKELRTKKQEIYQHQLQRPPAQSPEPSTKIDSARELINILDLIEKATNVTQVTPHIFEPVIDNVIDEENRWFTSYKIQLEVVGTYADLVSFINHVLQLPYWIVIENCNLQKANETDGALLKMQLLLTIYINISTTAQNIKKMVIPAAKRDVFQQEPYTKNLHLWSIDELQFLGSIRQEGTTLGVISDPLGGVYQVKINDKIGLNQAKVVAIDERGIITEK